MARGKQVSADLCWTVVRLQGYSVPKTHIALYTDLSERMIDEIQHRFRVTGDPTGNQDKIKKRRGRKLCLGYQELEFIRGSIERRPDLYLREIVEELGQVYGVDTSEVSVWRALRRMGMTRKKITKLAIERKQVLRDEYLAVVGCYSPEQLVFVDESAVDRRTPGRAYGWAPSGGRAVMHGHFVRGSRYSLLPALCLGGIIHLEIVEGSFDGSQFMSFLENLLDTMQPYPAPRSVLVMDNCAIHKIPGVRELVQSRGMQLLYLPPYSPDYNPIELAFSSIKSMLRRQSIELRALMTGRKEDHIRVLLWLHRAVYTVTPEKAEAWFRKCGYIV